MVYQVWIAQSSRCGSRIRGARTQTSSRCISGSSQQAPTYGYPQAYWHTLRRTDLIHLGLNQNHHRGTSSSVSSSKVEYLSSNVLDIFSDAIKASWNLSSYGNTSTLACKEVSFKLLVVLLEYHVLITIILGCELGTQVNEMDDVM